MFLGDCTRICSDGKKRAGVALSCDYCGNLFLRTKKDYNLKSKDFCTTKCRSNSVNITYECDHCGTQFSRKPSAISKSRSGKVFCSRQCKDVGQTYIKEIQPTHYGTGGGRHDYRTRALDFYGEACARCGYDESLHAIEVHHKDRDRTNNDLSNLEVLCCNCHAIEHRGGVRGP